MSQKPIHRVFTVVSMAMFLGSLVFSTFKLYSSALEQKPKENAVATAQFKQSQLAANERGYELVLQREPGNEVALRGLVDTRLQMNDAEGAKEALAKLIKLHPQQKEYKVLLAQVKQRVGE